LLRRACVDNDVTEKEWSTDALTALEQHRFPGNVRELVHIVDRLAILTASDVVTGVDVQRALSPTQAPLPTIKDDAPLPLDGTLYAVLESLEKKILDDRIKKWNGNMSRAAEDLGLERSHLYKKIKRFQQD
jgi:two-component system, NtrC family, nitrogen regulation response regulator NtrX